jgi:serine/threonine protein phosphatase 1
MSRTRLTFERWPAAIYAIGDVHGCLTQLLDIEAQMLADGATIKGEKWLVTLGDYVDRGPASAGVINHLLDPPPEGWRRVALLGNHEQMMLNFLGDPFGHFYWLDQGGTETLASYGIDLKRRFDEDSPDAGFARELARAIPAEHREFVAGLPIALSLPGWLFVHAGIRPGLPLDLQDDDDLIWIRSEFLEVERTDGLRVVHGHTPGPEPFVTASRIGLDTGCFYTGRLSGMRITPDGTTQLFSSTAT